MMYLLPAHASNIIRVFSFGGGVQSTAVMVLQAQGKFWQPYDYFIFANVGADSENPGTLDYIERYTKPYAEKHGLKFIEVQKLYKGKPGTLMSQINRPGRSVPIPARMSNGAPGNRSCTSDFKIHVVDRWIKQHRYTHATVGLGISLDEFSRMRGESWHDRNGTKKLGFWKRREHPLLDRRLNRNQCHTIITAAGLPTPPKSSCFFCPFHRPNEWIDMKRESPDLFNRAVEVETVINQKRGATKKDYVYLHSKCIPLTFAVGDQPLLPGLADEMETCESGYCMV